MAIMFQSEQKTSIESGRWANMKLENPSLINEDMYTENDMEEFANCFLTVLVAGLELFAVAFGVYTIITSL